MKKLVFCILLCLAILTACQKRDTLTIQKSELFQPYQVMVPSSLEILPELNDNNDYVTLNHYHNPDFAKLYTSIQHTKTLLENFNQYINDNISGEIIQVDEVYQEDKRYKVEFLKKGFDLSIYDAEGVILKATKTGETYKGKFNLGGDQLEFESKAGVLTLSFISGDQNSTVQERIETTDEALKIMVQYRDPVTAYHLYLLAEDQHSALWVSDLKQESERLSIQDQEGSILYEAYKSNNHRYQGYHLHALEGYETISKLDETTFKVDQKNFPLLTGQSNLFSVRQNYTSVGEVEVILFGSLEDFTHPNLPSLREPFTTTANTVIERLLRELYDFKHQGEA